MPPEDVIFDEEKWYSTKFIIGLLEHLFVGGKKQDTELQVQYVSAL
jgi:hypothetical protein